MPTYKWSRERLLANIEAIDAKLNKDARTWEVAYNDPSYMTHSDEGLYDSFLTNDEVASLIRKRYYWSKLLRTWYGISVLSDWILPDARLKEVDMNGVNGA